MRVLMVNPILDKLKKSAHAALAGALRQRQEVILRRWQELVKQNLPTADALTWDALRDDLPRTLEELADTLATPSSSSLKNLLGDAAEHGLCRYHQSYNLNELMVEYSLLRAVVMEEVSANLQRPLDTGELVILGAGLDQVVRRGVLAFTNHQKQELQTAAEAQSKYLSFLSHDLRGALNGILLMIEVLRLELAGEERFSTSLEDLEMMRRSILETVSTMDRFLHAERLRKGKVQLKLDRIDLKALTEEICNQFSLSAHNKKLQVHCDLDDCHAITDRELVTLVLQNLLGNAVKYTRKGTIHVTLRCGGSAEGKKGAAAGVISVADEGPGIAPEQLEKLFVPFSRGQTHGESGVGLGLAIARQAADLAGVKLWAESQVGKGSAFHMEFPRREM
jgi:signal transduction histidine kinase